MTFTTTLFASLDNRVEASGDWQFPWFDEEYFGALSATWAEADALLVGATSFAGYEEVAQTFPDSPMVALMRATPTYVVSSKRTSSEAFADARWLPDASSAIIRDLERRHENIAILGSPSLVIELLEARLLQTLSLAVLPIVAGEGRGLYDTAIRRITFQSAVSRSLSNGITLLELNAQALGRHASDWVA